jgi:hypothetical protein
MNKEDKEMILELIEKQQKEQTSLLKLFRDYKQRVQSWKLQGNKQMVEWCEERVQKFFRMARMRQEMIEDLALLGNIRTIKFQDEVLLEDQVIKTKAGVFVKGLCMGLEDKARNPHERRMCSRVN